MAEVTTQELKELILTKFSELDKKSDLRAAELDKKIDVGLAHVATEIARLDGKIDTLQGNLEGKISTLQGNLEGKIGSLEAKVDSIDRRIGNEEIVSRSLFIAVIGGLVAGLIKFLFFSSSFA
jgi:hypothetical protein